MSEGSISLLDLPRQASLPLSAELEAEAQHDHAAIAASPTPRSPIFSGERLYRSDPERYALFCRLYFEAGLSQMESCKLLGMSPQSGAAIISREQASMSAARLRQVQAARARAVVSLALSAMQDRLSDPEALAAVPLRDLAQAAQRAHEIAALLSGEATSRTERPDAGRASALDAAAYLDAVEVGPAQPILEGGNAVAREALPAGLQAGLGAGSGADRAGLGADQGAAHDAESCERMSANHAARDAESRDRVAQGVAVQGLGDSAMLAAARMAGSRADAGPGAGSVEAGAAG
jgi:hypothetical protein